MILGDCKKGQIVSFFVYMGNRITATGPVANQALVFARIIGVGAQRVTLITEYGYRAWKYPQDLHLSPEGAEYVKDVPPAHSGE